MADYATLLRDHGKFAIRSVDRIFLQGYVPKLQSVGQVCTYLHQQRGYHIPSSAAFGRIGEAYVGAIHRWASDNAVPVRRFSRGENKEEIARPLIEAAAKANRPGVVLIGTGQEKSSAWRSWKAKGQEQAAHPHMEWGRQMAFVNHFYLYLWDEEWGGAFVKTNAYAPWPLWMWLNGHEWAKRQCDKQGIRYQSLDNGFRSCEDPEALQAICDGLGAQDVLDFFQRWEPQLPSPLTADDRKAGYTYSFAFRQFEISDTRVFDRPAAGRAFFEGLIRDHLDIGRPSSVALIFGRRVNSKTPGTFRTKIITEGVDPQLCCYYKSSRMKMYFKEHRALRTETVVGDTYNFGIGRLMTTSNWNALRAVGEAANKRLCDALALDAQPAPDVETFAAVTQPSKTTEGLYAPALRFGDPRVVALFSALVGFCHLAVGFNNGTLTDLMSSLLNEAYTARQATYDLRRLRRKALIVRLPHSFRYQLTPLGRRVAVLFTKAYGRALTPGLAALDPRLPSDLGRSSPLAKAWRDFDKSLDAYLDDQLIAA